MERKRMSTSKAVIFAATGVSLFFLLKDARGQETEPDTNSSMQSLFKQAMDKTHAEEFDEAIRLGKLIRENYPDEPAGAFVLLISYQTIMRNYRIKDYESQIDSLMDLAIDLAQKAVKNDKKDGKNYFYLGCAYGCRSIHHAQKSKWLDAFKDGTQVLKNFNKAIAYSPDFYDSYYGLGLYKYWFGAKSKVLRILPFAKDNRQEGIEQMKLAIEKGEYLNIDAMYGLSAAYFNEGAYQRALQLTDKLYEHYPNNPSLNYRRGLIYRELGRWSDAKKSFEHLYNILTDSKYQSISYQVECLYQMAKCQYELGNYFETKRLCREAIALEKQCDFSREIDGPLESYADIKDKLYELNDQVKSLELTQVKEMTTK